MKKGFYLVVAFLLGGATLTLNSCIDTTEPAGIEAMRTAKAEYLKALADFRAAKAMLEMVEAEKAKLELEIMRLEYEADKYDAMAAVQEAMYEYYTRVAEAEKEYLESVIRIKMALINMKDEVVAEEMIEYEEKLTEALEHLNNARKRLAVAEIEKYVFEKDKELLVEYMQIQMVEKTQEIEILEAFIAKLEEIAKIDVTDTENLEKQLVEAKQALKALDNEVVEKMREILKKKQYSEADAREIAKLEMDIYNENAKKKNTETFKVNKNDISTLVSDEFNGILREFNESVVNNDKYQSKMESNIAEIYDSHGDMMANYSLKGVQLNEYESVIGLLISYCKEAINLYGDQDKVSAWNALIKTFEDQVTDAKKKIQAINEAVAEINDDIKKIKEKYDAKLCWADELECFMIKGDTAVTVDGKEYKVFSENNPYYTVAKLGDIATRGRAIQETIAQLEYAIQNKTYTSFLCYDEATGKVVTIGGTGENATTLQKFIEEKIEDLLAAKEEKIEIEAFLKAFEEKGLIIFEPENGEEGLDELDGLSIVSLDEINDAIEALKREVAAWDKIVQVYKETIDKIIAAYESGELFEGTPFEGEEKPETDQPTTEEPEAGTEEGAEE